MLTFLCRLDGGYHGFSYSSNVDLRTMPPDVVAVYLKDAKRQADAAVGRAITKTWS